MKLNLTNIITGLLLVAIPALFGILFSYESRISKLEGGTDTNQIANLEATIEGLRSTDLVSLTNELSNLQQAVNSLEILAQTHSEPFILFEDDFSMFSELWSNWGEYENDDILYSMYLSNEKLRFDAHSIDKGGALIGTDANIGHFPNFILSAEFRIVNQQGTPLYGLRFRKNKDTYYTFQIVESSNTQFIINKWDALNQEWAPAESMDWTTSPHIKRKGVNILRIAANGKQINFYINGHQVAILTNEPISGGNVGIFVNTQTDDSLELEIDNFEMIEYQ